MRYKLVLWDFDGTLADTLGGLVEWFNELAGLYGWKPVEETERLRELTLPQIMREHGVSLYQLPGLLRRWLGQHRKRAQAAVFFPGIAEVLKQLHQAGCVLGVLSSNDQECIRECLNRNGVEELFAFIEARSPLFGKARRLRKLVARSRLPRKCVLYVGDETRDVDAAKEAGVPVAAVTWGFNAEEVLRSHGPTHLVHAPCELLEVCLQEPCRNQQNLQPPTNSNTSA